MTRFAIAVSGEYVQLSIVRFNSQVQLSGSWHTNNNLSQVITTNRQNNKI